jgi:putative membrane protein
MSTPTFLAADTSQVLLVEHWGGPGAWWPVFPILWVLLVAAIVTTVVLVGRRNRALAGPRAGEARLAERFASGEISEQEYRERRAVLKEQSR